MTWLIASKVTRQFLTVDIPDDTLERAAGSFLIRSASTRPRVSVGPPAGNGTTTVIGRVGNDCARAKRQVSSAAS